MTDLAVTDFAQLDEFSLAWRWTRPTHDSVPADVLATIRPLTAAGAAALAPTAATRCADRRVSELELAISAEWYDPEPVRQRLAALGIPAETEVVASWNARTAVVTRWGTFARYWDTFCYPASDDVTVWAPGGDWVLCYRHFQFIEFGRLRGAV